jgi:hypothetical protein
MRIYEILIDKLIETSLFEMAFDRKTAKNKITDLSPLIFEHLLKLFVFNYPQGRDHWITELNGWFKSINKIYLKSTNKKPSGTDIYTWLIFESAPHYDVNYLEDQVQIMIYEDYKNIPIHNYDPSWTLNKILSIIQNVSSDISKNKFRSIRDYLP